MAIQKRTREVFYSEVANKHFFTKKAAIRAEARAIVSNRYPSERPEYEDGVLVYPGYHVPDSIYWPMVDAVCKAIVNGDQEAIEAALES